MTKRQLTNDELIQISRNADWQSGFVELGIKKDETKSKINDWWGWSPFNPNEKTASFHLNEKGYYCFSTQKGGNFVELVKNVLEFPTFTEAGYWCLEHNISSLKESIKSKDQNYRSEGKKKLEHDENEPIKHDLIPLLSLDHPIFENELKQRGVSKETCKYLGFGYLEKGKIKDIKSPINDRVVFQIRSIKKGKNGDFRRVILAHAGRALNDEKISTEGKYWIYSRS